METIQKPKKKDGRYYLKKKVAKLEEEREALAGQLLKAHAAVADTKRQLAEARNELMREIEKSARLAENSVKANEFIVERYVWLYEHAPFWLKWWFRMHFKASVK